MGGPTDERSRLRPDCGSCVGLCCVALPFARSADFALDKPAGMPCPNLGGDDQCTIHARLPQAGFRGCTAFDCLGAGQQVTQVTFGGASWRQSRATAAAMFSAFVRMRGLYEMRWYVAEAETRLAGGSGEAQELTRRVGELAARLRRQAQDDEVTVAALDLDDLRAEVGPLLAQVSVVVRGAPAGADLSYADLAGQDVRGPDLVGANLRGALLIGADLRRQDLTRADLLGADLRGADVRGADLTGALFALPAQLAAARGDATTRLPALVPRPSSWS